MDLRRHAERPGQRSVAQGTWDPSALTSVTQVFMASRPYDRSHITVSRDRDGNSNMSNRACCSYWRLGTRTQKPHRTVCNTSCCLQLCTSTWRQAFSLLESKRCPSYQRRCRGCSEFLNGSNGIQASITVKASSLVMVWLSGGC